MDWKSYYQSHIVSGEEAVSKIQSGDRIVIGHACGEPSFLVETMVKHAEDYQNVEVVHMVAMGECAYAQPGMESHFRHNAIFVGGKTRDAINSGRGDFTPCFFFEVPKLFHTTMPIYVAMVTVTPPNEEGFVSLGVSVDYGYEAVKAAKVIIAQVNDQMPFTYGNLIPVERINYFVEHSAPIIELPPPKIGEVEKAIGENCASLIRDGDTLQLGIGAIPDAVLMFLKGKHDLGIHSEMFSDGVVDLVDAGVITNKRKTCNNGKFVANFLMGTKRLYDFVDHNPDVLMKPVDYVNHPAIIAQNDNLVSINSCVQVDLMGQISSESIGPMQISGVGGQVDFIRGAALSNGGRSIIAMPSTASHGTISRIVSQLDAGGTVTTSRADVDYVVTEYGIAHLKGHTLQERGEALIKIAHPDFRDELKRNFSERFVSLKSH